MDETMMPSLMIFPGFLPNTSLLESLIQVSNDVTSMQNLPLVQVKNISNMIRRIKLLSSLFEDMQESNGGLLPPSSILCLTELFSVIKRVKILLQSCKDGSFLWNLMQTESLANQVYGFVNEIGKALDILPLSLLNITTDTKEQVELLHKQAKRTDVFVDHVEIHTRYELLEMISEENKKNNKFDKVKDFLNVIGLRSELDYAEEISKLEAEAEKQVLEKIG